MDENLTIETLITQHDLLQHIESARRNISSRLCLDDAPMYDDTKILLLESELNDLYSEYTFKIVSVFGGYAQDLLITNKEAKKRYDAIPKTKTYKDLYKLLHDEYGIHSSGTFYKGLNEKITDHEFESLLNFHLNLSKMTAQAFKE